jgi:hypothetical protein
MKITDAFKDLKFVGLAEGDRVAYHVFEGPKVYLVAAPGSRGGIYVNLVDRSAVEADKKRFAGKEVVSKQIGGGLSSLYTLVARGEAKKLKKRLGRSMVFKLK